MKERTSLPIPKLLTNLSIIRQRRSSSTPVCYWPVSGWCPSCGSWSLPQFFAGLSSVDNVSAVPLGPNGVSTLVLGVGILAQHVPNPAPPLPGDDGLHILLLASCEEVTVGDGSWQEEALDFPEACRVEGRQFGEVMFGSFGCCY